MRETLKRLILAAAALAAPAAHALILSTWKLPSNTESLEAEYAANTNVVAVLNFGRSADGESVTLLYRRPGGTLAAQSFGEDAFMSKLRLVKGFTGGARSAATASLHAEDIPENYKDGSGAFADTWLGGDSRGEGDWSGPWKHIGGTADCEAGFTEGGKMSLTLNAGTGETVVGRELAAPLASGEFSVDALLDAGDSFRGFAVYDGGTELIRWGIGGDYVSQSGFGYSLDHGLSFTFFESDLPGGTVADTYTMTWARLGNGDPGLEFTLAGPYWDDPVTVAVSGAASVDTIALFVVADTVAFNNEIAFTRVSAGGTPVSAVPEPATLGLLAAGTALAAAGRRRPGKKTGRGAQGPRGR